jgi:hypothetical protein
MGVDIHDPLKKLTKRRFAEELRKAEKYENSRSV